MIPSYERLALSEMKKNYFYYVSFPFLFFGTTAPQWSRFSSFTRFLDQTRLTTVRRTTLDEGSARRRDLFLTTHTLHQGDFILRALIILWLFHLGLSCTVFVLICTVVVLYCFVMCVCVCVCVCVCMCVCVSFCNVWLFWYYVIWLRFFLTWLRFFLNWLRFFLPWLTFFRAFSSVVRQMPG